MHYDYNTYKAESRERQANASKRTLAERLNIGKRNNRRQRSA